jgi:hypothetical protein
MANIDYDRDRSGGSGSPASSGFDRYGYGRGQGWQGGQGSSQTRHSQGMPGDMYRDAQGDAYGDIYGSAGGPDIWSYTEYWLIPGPYMGVGPQGYQRSDERIREDVNDRLTQHGQINARDIQVQVRNGEVTLTGMVDDRRQKRMAEDTVESVPGVTDVHHQLKVHEGLLDRIKDAFTPNSQQSQQPAQAR